MSELVSVGGVCFVAVEPKTRTHTENTEKTEKTESAESEVETREVRTDAGTEVLDGTSGGKRKYRAQGERTRKEQQRAASRNYRLRHLEYYREYGLKYRAERKRLQVVTS